MLMIPKYILEKAISGGWKILGNVVEGERERIDLEGFEVQTFETTAHFRGKDTGLERLYQSIIADADFWIALGRALGWHNHYHFGHPPISVMPPQFDIVQPPQFRSVPEWRWHALEYFDLLLSKPTPEQVENYWREITN